MVPCYASFDKLTIVVGDCTGAASCFFNPSTVVVLDRAFLAPRSVEYALYNAAVDMLLTMLIPPENHFENISNQLLSNWARY